VARRDYIALVSARDPLRQSISAFVDHYNRERYHEALANVTLAHVHYGRRESILTRRKKPQIRALAARRLRYRRTVGKDGNMEAGTPEVYLNSSADSSR
jgi:hypothetical protein